VVRADAYPKTQFQGRIARILPVADRAKGAVGVRIHFAANEKTELLRPEMSATVEFLEIK
jgi:multidrug efflux pump subunit AcrA (membrane-fusion protein)